MYFHSRAVAVPYCIFCRQALRGSVSRVVGVHQCTSAVEVQTKWGRLCWRFLGGHQAALSPVDAGLPGPAAASRLTACRCSGRRQRAGLPCRGWRRRQAGGPRPRCPGCGCWQHPHQPPGQGLEKWAARLQLAVALPAAHLRTGGRSKRVAGQRRRLQRCGPRRPGVARSPAPPAAAHLYSRRAVLHPALPHPPPALPRDAEGGAPPAAAGAPPPFPQTARGRFETGLHGVGGQRGATCQNSSLQLRRP